jgi:hypothetical protein
MTNLRITAGPYSFRARLEEAKSPRTCARFLSLLPYRERIIHVRWSGEACWIPMGAMDLGLPYEDATSHPAPGEVILYPGGVSETEILLGYGGVRFASKAGQLAGNHFLTIFEGNENLRALGRLCLWEGAQNILFERD